MTEIRVIFGSIVRCRFVVRNNTSRLWTAVGLHARISWLYSHAIILVQYMWREFEVLFYTPTHIGILMI